MVEMRLLREREDEAFNRMIDEEMAAGATLDEAIERVKERILSALRELRAERKN